MADKPDVFLMDGRVRLVGGGDSPEVEIEGGNHWDLANSDGDVRIGTEDHMVKIGVATSGGGAGNANIWASSDLKLGSNGESVVSIDDGGLSPDGSDYALGSSDDPWEETYTELLAVTGRVGTDLIPDTPVAQTSVSTEDSSLGSARAPWDELFVGDVLAGEIETRGISRSRGRCTPTAISR